jgi:hypothetical protein
MPIKIRSGSFRLWNGEDHSTNFRAVLPDDFPVNARFQAGEATAIHSLDLLLPTYQDREEVRRAVRRLVSRQADFSGPATRGVIRKSSSRQQPLKAAACFWSFRKISVSPGWLPI